MSNMPRQFKRKQPKNGMSVDQLRSSLKLVPKRAEDITQQPSFSSAPQGPPQDPPDFRGKGMSIDFLDRVLPKTMLIDVATQEVRIGNATDKMKDIAPICTVNSGVHGGVVFLTYLKSLTANDIEKVILDKKTNFRIRTLAEFTEDIAKYVANPAVAAGNAARTLQQVSDNEIIVEKRDYTPAEADAAIGMLDAQKKITSNAQWPQDSTFGTIADSSDIHDTYIDACTACAKLEKDGFGGSGVVFPIRTWIDYANN